MPKKESGSNQFGSQGSKNSKKWSCHADPVQWQRDASPTTWKHKGMRAFIDNKNETDKTGERNNTFAAYGIIFEQGGRANRETKINQSLENPLKIIYYSSR